MPLLKDQILYTKDFKIQINQAKRNPLEKCFDKFIEMPSKPNFNKKALNLFYIGKMRKSGETPAIDIN